VTVQTSASTYRPTDPIHVTILNQTTRSIAFANHQSDCTIALLQRELPDAWETVAPCRLMTITRVFTLKPGASQVIILKGYPQPWPIGDYRIVFRYSVKTAGSPPSSSSAYSSLFHIKG
jgi:hypothetical protein